MPTDSSPNFRLYVKDGFNMVEFNHEGTKYDVKEEDALAFLGTLGLLFLFLLFIAALAHDSN